MPTQNDPIMVKRYNDKVNKILTVLNIQERVNYL